MIRALSLAGVFAIATLALLFVMVSDPSGQDDSQMNVVSRADPVDMSFDGLTTAPTTPDTASPVTAPPPAATAAAPQPEVPSAGQDTAGNGSRAEPKDLSGEDDVMRALRAMSYGILDELKKPVDTASSPTGAVKTTRADPAESAVTDDGRVHTVQDGESLAGIAFRYYGTTVAYLNILEANRDVLADVSDIRPGMRLRIPDI